MGRAAVTAAVTNWWFLQVNVQVQAFLTLPDLTADGVGGLDDRCQVIQPFTIETAVEHCVEPTSTGNYRCLLLTIYALVVLS